VKALRKGNERGHQEKEQDIKSKRKESERKKKKKVHTRPANHMGHRRGGSEPGGGGAETRKRTNANWDKGLGGKKKNKIKQGTRRREEGGKPQGRRGDIILHWKREGFDLGHGQSELLQGKRA